MTKVKPATHILFRSDFRDHKMWTSILEAHGIEWGDASEPDEITIRSTVLKYEPEDIGWQA
jgi:hypothetical protein